MRMRSTRYNGRAIFGGLLVLIVLAGAGLVASAQERPAPLVTVTKADGSTVRGRLTSIESEPDGQGGYRRTIEPGR